MEFRERNPPAELTITTHAPAVWNMLGGEINWSGFEIACEVLGIEDVQQTLEDLLVLRDTMNKERISARSKS